MESQGSQPQTAVNRNKCPKCGMAVVHWFDEYGSYSRCTWCEEDPEVSYKMRHGGELTSACSYCGCAAVLFVCHGDGTATIREPICDECRDDYLWDVHHSIRHGYVYLVDSQIGYYKIGRSNEPVERFRKFDVMLPYDMKVIALIETKDMHKLEKELHKRFAEWRVRGEWFALNPQQVLFIKRIAEVQP